MSFIFLMLFSLTVGYFFFLSLGGHLQRTMQTLWSNSRITSWRRQFINRNKGNCAFLQVYLKYLYRTHIDHFLCPLKQLCQRICNDPALVLQTRDGGGPVVKEMAKELLGSIEVDEADFRSTKNSCKLSFILDLVVCELCELSFCYIYRLLWKLNCFCCRKICLSKRSLTRICSSKRNERFCYFPKAQNPLFLLVTFYLKHNVAPYPLCIKT